MAKKSTPAWSDNFTHPADIFEAIEQKSTGLAPDDPYRHRVDELMAKEIADCKDPDTQQDLEAIRSLFHGDAFEEAARKVGFVLGFEYCRELLTRETRKGAR